MYDVWSVKKRFFPITLHAIDKEGKEHSAAVEVLPPQVGALHQMMASVKDKSNSIADMRAAVRKVLSHNKTGYVVPNDYVDAMDLDQLKGFLNVYFEWVTEAKKN